MVQGVLVQDGHIVDTNPATGEVISRVPCTTEEGVTQAIVTAKAAQAAWLALGLDKRIELLKAAVAELATHEEKLVELIVKEMGKVLHEAKEEASGACDKDEWLDLVAEANQPVIVENGLIVRAPHGVVAVISPWNFPADEILLLALPALAAGNTVVLKPSEVVPLTGKLVAESLQSVLPPGVMGIVQGDGAVGAMLVNGPVNMVAMTGSSATGRKIMSACARDLKRLVLELGGKDPMVVFADADLDKAAQDAVQFSMMNCGQVCCSVERVYVEESIKPQFEAKCVELIGDYKVGPGSDPASKVGPMVSGAQRELVIKQVADAETNGARVLFRGTVPENTPEEATFYPPTVLTDVTADILISREETFGPVLAISSFDGSEEAAVALSNDSEYGLAAYVYSEDLKKAGRVARGIHAGQVGINNYTLEKAPAACPWVGAKGSGFGYHSGMDGWRQFSVPKSLIYNDEKSLHAGQDGQSNDSSSNGQVNQPDNDAKANEVHEANVVSNEASDEAKVAATGVPNDQPKPSADTNTESGSSDGWWATGIVVVGLASLAVGWTFGARSRSK